MRALYALFFLFGFTQILQSQPIVTPVQGNPVIRSHAAKNYLKHKKLYDQYQPSTPLRNSMGSCPEFFNFPLVEAGQEIFVPFDTVGLGGGTIGDSLFFTPCDPLQYGTFEGIASVDFIYRANLNIEVAGENVETETVCLTFHRENSLLSDTLLTFDITIKRRGRFDPIPMTPMPVQPRSVNEFCLDEFFIRFDPGYEIACSELYDFPDPLYDGEGVDGHNFSYLPDAYPDTCLVYYSNRFPGTDNIAMVLCDDFAICDTFLVPFIIPETRITPDPITVFFDDFSYDSPYPDTSLWLDGMVYRNNSMAYQPPSIGVCTFDGLDERGREYDIEFEGIGDILTSKPIDMSGLDEDDDYALRFFIQRKGFGLGPSFADSFYVEFKDKNLDWVYQTGMPGFSSIVPTDSLEEFTLMVVELDDDDWFHEDFQFRFIGRVSPAGVSDLWHLDYVSLESLVNREAIDFEDVAYTAPPTSFLNNYTAMPWKHFVSDIPEAIGNSINWGINNLNAPGGSNNIINLGGEPAVNLDEIVTNDPFSTTLQLVGAGAAVNLQPLERIDTTRTFDSAIETSIEDYFSSIVNTGEEKRVVETSYNIFGITDGNNRPENDFVSITNTFDNYFAYDDGIAEGQVFFTGSDGGEMVAVKYTPTVDDALVAVQLHFPHVNGDVQNQEFQIQVWEGNEKPTNMVFESDTYQPFYVDNVLDTMQGFTTYRLRKEGTQDSVAMVAGQNFYIAFVQLTPANFGIPIGMDRNNSMDPNEVFWSPNGIDFFDFNNISSSAPMIRAVVETGSGIPEDSTADVQDINAIKDIMQIYPNPTDGRLFVQLKKGQFQDYQIAVFNNVGQLVQQQTLSNELLLDQVGAGIYYLRIDNLKTKDSYYQKIIKQN